MTLMRRDFWVRNVVSNQMELVSRDLPATWSLERCQQNEVNRQVVVHIIAPTVAATTAAALAATVLHGRRQAAQLQAQLQARQARAESAAQVAMRNRILRNQRR